MDEQKKEEPKPAEAPAAGGATLDRKQAIVVVSRERFLELCRYLKDEEKFDFLTDLTGVDWLARRPRFEVILNLYSFSRNERLRLKVPVDDACPRGAFPLSLSLTPCS